MTSKKLSIIIPLYNEKETIARILERIAGVELLEGIVKEIIVVDDCSSDNSRVAAAEFQKDHSSLDIQLFSHKKNRGKGACLQTGMAKATGDYIVIQDADLEYDPADYNALLKPVVDGYADVVYGTRFSGSKPHRILFFWHSIGNKFLTVISNLFTNLNLTDMETCYKLFDAGMLKSLKLKEKRFGFEPEVTAKISRVKGVRIYEVGVSYYGRSYADGKKIGWRDGIWAIYCVLKYNIFSRR